MLLTFISTICFLIILTLIISVHELGHLFFAKKNNVYCFEYSIGMGPIIFCRKKGETIYSVRLFPIGGYVQLMDSSYTSPELCSRQKYSVACTDKKCYLSSNDKKLYSKLQTYKINISTLTNIKYKVGENDVELIGYDLNNNFVRNKAETLVICSDKEEINITGKSRDFYYLKLLNKIFILISGAIANLILAFLLFFVAFSISGIPSNNSTVENDIISPSIVGEENVLLKGDEIIECNGIVVKEIKDFIDLINNDKTSETLNLVIKRDGKIININRKIYNKDSQTGSHRYVGISFIKNHNLISIIKFSFLYFLNIVHIILNSVFNIIKGKIALSNLTGMLGIAKETRNILTNYNSHDVCIVSSNLLMFSGILSANIGIMNIIPIPILDGGRVVILIIERALNKRLSSKVLYAINVLSIVILLGLFLYITILDILRLGS